jgi:hypothetical protein
MIERRRDQSRCVERKLSRMRQLSYRCAHRRELARARQGGDDVGDGAHFVGSLKEPFSSRSAIFATLWGIYR